MGTPNSRTLSRYVNKKFGRLTILKFHDRATGGFNRWWARCECGVEKVVNSSGLLDGRVVSCGCYNEYKRKTRGGLAAEYLKEYKAWHALVTRCTKPDSDNYSNYGGRGITVDPTWLGRDGFKNFLEHIGPCPNTGYSVDRKKNNEGYKPGNVRWADCITQNNNRRTSHYLTHDGRTQPIRAWAAELGINEQTLHERLKRGWTVERALTTPLHGRR